MNTRLTRRVTSYTIQHICILQIHFKVIFFNNGYIFVLKIHNSCSNFPISSYVEILVISTKCENTDKQKQQQKSLLKKLYLLRNTSFVLTLSKVSRVTPSFPNKCIIHGNFQSFKLVVILTWHKFFFSSLNSNKGLVSESARGFWLCHDKIYLMLLEGSLIFLRLPTPPSTGSWLAIILLWSPLDILLATTDPSSIPP